MGTGTGAGMGVNSSHEGGDREPPPPPHPSPVANPNPQSEYINFLLPTYERSKNNTNAMKRMTSTDSNPEKMLNVIPRKKKNKKINK